MESDISGINNDSQIQIKLKNKIHGGTTYDTKYKCNYNSNYYFNL